MKKPILLLDVDGVLNVVGRGCEPREVRLEWGPGQFHSFYPTMNSKLLLKLAWSRFDVRWLTAWRKGANMIARWAGLEERPVIMDSPLVSVDWKATAAERALKSWKGRVAWIEDGISDEAKTLVARKGWTYFHCDPFVGVTEEHLKGLEEFADNGVRRSEER